MKIGTRKHRIEKKNTKHTFFSQFRGSEAGGSDEKRKKLTQAETY